jgi:two-component system response regulator FixJ
MSSPHSFAYAPVCVVDADPGFRAHVVTHLEQNGMPCRGHADAAAFFKDLRQRRPGCVIMDLNLPDMHGLEVQRALVSQYTSLPLIFVADHAPVPTVAEAMRLGAADFALKPVEMDTLMEQTRAVLEAARQMDGRDMRREAMRRRLRTLTAREHHILTLALTGKSNKEISLLLGISHRTVETHRGHILQKIGVSNLLEIAHVFADLSPFVVERGKVYEPEYEANRDGD